MPRVPALLLALALGTAALALASCGGGKDARLLPGETAREITANLDTVQQLSAEGDCAGADSAAQQVGEQIEALEGVDTKLKRALEAGATRLNEVIATCEEEPVEAVAPAVVPSEEEEGGGEEKPPKEKANGEKEAKSQEEQAPEPPAEEPSLPPQAKGEGKGLNGEQGPPSGEEGGGGGPSGGVGPGSPAGEAE
jgi:hypothetical protein